MNVYESVNGFRSDVLPVYKIEMYIDNNLLEVKYANFVIIIY